MVKLFDEFKENFEWLGFDDNPYKIMKHCDYQVLLSDDETWGLVLTESMILNVPCITTDFDAAFEQINQDNGIILSRKDLNSYKDYIETIVKNKNKFKKAVSNYLYDNNQIIKEWIKLLEEK